MSGLSLTLVHARGAAAQQAALDAWLADPEARGASRESDARTAAADERQRAVIVEAPSLALRAPDDVSVQRVVAGCVCCTGQVPLRVAITRSVRGMDLRRPRALLLLVSNGEHLARLREQIQRDELGTGITLV